MNEAAQSYQLFCTGEGSCHCLKREEQDSLACTEEGCNRESQGVREGNEVNHQIQEEKENVKQEYREG